MNILVDIGHPGHVHLLKNTIKLFKNNGHTVIITVKDIPIAKHLLEIEGLDYFELGKKSNSIAGKALNQVKYNYQLLRMVKKFRIDIGVGSSLTLAQISVISKMTSIILDDDDDVIQPLFVKYGHPFADVILTPDAILRKSKKALYYSGTHELAYLHPKYFTPDPAVIREIGLTPEDTFFIMRFVALKGHHDIGHSGISFEQKKRLIELLKPYGRIFITSEKEIEPELEEYRLPVSAEKIHSLMYYATLFLGDSQTMTSEAAILGTPALKCNSFAGRLSVPNELENKYGLCYSYTPAQFEDFYAHAAKMLKQNDLKTEWKKKCERFLNDKIDVTAFFVWFIENNPQSYEKMKLNPEYQYIFR